jgi:hypothetical protein
MKVVYEETLARSKWEIKHGIVHSIEIGWSTWNPDEVSLRNRYDKKGKFSPRGSSEIPLRDLPALMRVALERLPEVVRAREQKAP